MPWEGLLRLSLQHAVQVVESLYGQDLDSGHHGSGFPLPPFRKRLLEEHLKATPARKPGHSTNCTCCSVSVSDLKYSPEEEVYSEHCWNINNLPRCKVTWIFTQHNSDTVACFSFQKATCAACPGF